MKNKKKKVLKFLFLLFFLMIIPITLSKYKEEFNKVITLHIRKPEYTVIYNQMLPDEYKEVDYIEVNGEQFVNTFYQITSNNIDIKTKVYVDETNVDSLIITNQDSNMAGFTLAVNDKSFYAISGSDANVVVGAPSSNDYEIELNYNYDELTKSLTVNGTTVTGTYNANLLDSTFPIFLFGDASLLNNHFKGKIYYLKIYEDEILKMNLVPCYRITDNSSGLYDMVGKKFYQSSSSEAFIKGNDVKTNYHEVDSQYFVYGTDQALVANTYERDGYKFKGWNTEANGTGELYKDLQVVSTISSTDGAIVNLYAKWNTIYTDYTIYEIFQETAVSDNIPSEFVTGENGIDFNQPSSATNGYGAYMISSTANDEYPIYYYRGDIDFNNVVFAGFCWKIVRTTETGGTKLVYNGVPAEDGSCNNVGANSQLGPAKFNNTTNKVGSLGYNYDSKYTFTAKLFTAVPSGTIFSNDVEFVDGKYNLIGDTFTKDETFDENKYDLLSKHHYTCLDGITSCTQVRFIYIIKDTMMFYVTLSDGVKIENLLNDELLNDDSTSNSTIKTYLETWYEGNMTSYTNLLEDTVFCNDKSIVQYGGWDRNGDVSQKILLGGYGRATLGLNPTLECVNPSDRYTVSSEIGNGRSRYKVGLLSMDEVIYSGIAGTGVNTNSYLYNESIWWTMSPAAISANISYIGVYHSMVDLVHSGYTTNGGGARPSISITNDIIIDDGFGTIDEPFIITLD